MESSAATSVREKLKRSLTAEFVRMEDDFDETRDLRKGIISKIMSEVDKVNLSDDAGNLKEDADVGIRVMATALKALSDAEKASAQAISLKLKQQENDIASAASAKDRIAIILKATAPGKITEEFDPAKLEDALEDMFGNEIKDFETKLNPHDLSD